MLEPEFNFGLVALFVGRFLEDKNFDVFVVVEIVHDDIGEFRHGAGADIASDALLVFVHKEEGIGVVEVAIETTIDFGHFDSIITLWDYFGIV